MKKDIHPKYYPDAKIHCACGAVLETGSTRKEITVEICSQCHPFYTGKKKVVDTTGRVDRFKKLSKKAATAKEAHVKLVTAKKKRKVKVEKDEKADKPTKAKQEK